MDRFQKLAADHAEWSQSQFGSDLERDWTGPLAHMRKEIAEVEEQPFDRDEWADMLLLLLDASRRSGLNATGLILAAEYKLSINKNRIWGDPNPDGSVEHIRAT